MSIKAAWMILAVGLAQLPAPADAAGETPLPTLGVPGLQLEGGSDEDRALLDEQLAAALEGAGFSVRDGKALKAMGARVPDGGCASSAAPLCGEVAGVDQVVLGRVVRSADGSSWVELQLVKTGSRRQLWRGAFTAANDAELPAGFSLVAIEHLPAPARQGNIPGPSRTLGLTRNQWGAGAFTAGTLLAVGSTTLFVVAERRRQDIRTVVDVSRPLFARDVLRWQTEVPLMQGVGTAAAVLGVAGMVGGFLLWNSPAEPAVSFSLTPTGDAGGLVFSGAF